MYEPASSLSFAAFVLCFELRQKRRRSQPQTSPQRVHFVFHSKSVCASTPELDAVYQEQAVISLLSGLKVGPYGDQRGSRGGQWQPEPEWRTSELQTGRAKCDSKRGSSRPSGWRFDSHGRGKRERLRAIELHADWISWAFARGYAASATGSPHATPEHTTATCPGSREGHAYL